MKFTETSLPGVFTIDLEPRGDDRGFFARMYDVGEFAEHGLETDYVQFNTSFSRIKHTFRGMHYQLGASAEVKVVKVIRGELVDFVLDLRDGSPTFGQWTSVTLSAENRTMIYIPRGCAHGFMSMTEDVEMQYFVSNYYDPAAERCVRWNDPMFDVTLPAKPAIISDKDAGAPDFDPVWHLGRES
ncbi:dTDP-4-dehydrorhamnose 3,5-epimerase [Nocardioides sp. Kera G14]|uniref:dTDP-4-dehydrorhamnose 3,5-epimerase n=1 Tax=Nocardioides sp. Kera G14 TaxID=2884264 RepID=UPI001D113032|nr:dTDP-4-dehydrorhamnose 3,5-epimerase [Nocardioides sp. Kera G14]UDY23110.1 dTDP-4-dehydrorhamnose 3,5-epimerase [Nocardioides sp. Kera G14]